MPLKEALLSLVGGRWGETLIPLGLAIIAIFFMMSSYRRRMLRRQAQPPRQTPLREPPSTPALNPQHQAQAQTRLKHDLEALMVELEEFSRSVSAQIDMRFAKLETAIQDADRRITALNRLTRRLAERNGQPVPENEAHDLRHEIVYELSDAGLTPIEIARDTGKTPGEIELILNLRKQVDGGH
ncbi:MAG: hypothetical protein GXY44_14295 [Phycisphaerales bacterium]|nr:hypothetical protein [Phycisphaerales bacterium]